MSSVVGDVFADTGFWIALVVKQDQYHDRARKWSLEVHGRITTTGSVLLELANALSRPTWRAASVRLIDHLHLRADIDIVPLSQGLWQEGWELYRTRPDKAWSLTDCTSFVVMRSAGLVDALSADDHFRQAGYRPLLLEERS